MRCKLNFTLLRLQYGLTQNNAIFKKFDRLVIESYVLPNSTDVKSASSRNKKAGYRTNYPHKRPIKKIKQTDIKK